MVMTQKPETEPETLIVQECLRRRLSPTINHFNSINVFDRSSAKVTINLLWILATHARFNLMDLHLPLISKAHII